MRYTGSAARGREQQVISILVSETDVDNPAAERLAAVETRLAIAQDAVSKDRSHSDEAAGQLFATLHDALSAMAMVGPDKEPLDARVLAALAGMKPLRDGLLGFVNVVNQSERSAELHQLIRPFLGSLLGLKHAPRNVINFNHLWCDPYRFFLWELFLSVISLLIVGRHYDEVARYLEAEYRFETSRGPQRAGFLKFDAYIKTLDEFRPRRLRIKRLSVAADLLKERTDLAFLGFNDIMQADFLLSMRGLLHQQDTLTRWFPRTLVYAEEFQRHGFDLFFAARSRENFSPIQAMLGVRDPAELAQRFSAIADEDCLTAWQLGGVPIPFERYLGLAALQNG